MITVRVPATTANLGPGFDCMGIALKLYNQVRIEEIEQGLEINIIDDSKRFLPRDESNYVYTAMERVFRKTGKRLKGLRLEIDSSIPVTRGLGSSSAGIVSGVVGANALLGNPLSTDELLSIACEIEGHPDNVAPALLGGFVVSFQEGRRIFHSKNRVNKHLQFGAMVPNFYLQTKKSRSVLPRYTSYKNAVFNVGHAAMLASGLINGDVGAISAGMKDRLHQAYRLPYIKGGEMVMKNASRFGAIGSYVSGAGPTIMSVLGSDSTRFQKGMADLIAHRLHNWHLQMLEVDNDGVTVTAD